MRYVIIGTGNISNTYVRAIANIGGSLVGVVSRSCGVPEAAPGIPSWTSLEAIDVDFDAVCVTTPNGLHHQGIIAAACMGKPVLTEKPLDISVEAMNSAIAACREAGVALAVAYQRRTAPDNLAVKRLLDAGELGRIYAADIRAKFYRPQRYYDSSEYRGGYAIDGGGPFIQQACHNLDIYTWFFGLPVQVVSMLDTFARNIEAEDHGAALMRHHDGMIGTIVASTVARPGFAARMEIHGSLGSVVLTDDKITHWTIDGIENPADPDYHYAHDGATSVAVADTSAHERILLDFERCVETGQIPIAGGESARLTTELILMIYDKTLKKSSGT